MASYAAGPDLISFGFRTLGSSVRRTRRFFNGPLTKGEFSTHDVATMTMFAYQRLADGLPMPGVIEVGTNVSVQQAIADILLIVEGSEPEEWACQITYLPL